MDTQDTTDEASSATATFERDLEALVLKAFTDGAELEGTWDIELPVEAAPDWTVEVSKTRPDAHPSEDSEFVTDR